MKLTKSQLRKIIKEEISDVLSENGLLNEITIIRGLYRTSEPEMEDILRDMANELHDQGGNIAAAVDAMERNVDDRKYSSARISADQARKYQGAQQYMTGREAFRKMMHDMGKLLHVDDIDDEGLGSFDDSQVEDAVAKIMAAAKRGHYSLRYYRENKGN